MMQSRHRRRRGSVIVIVLWAIAVAALVTSSVQITAQRQATMGRESLAKIQARWAARGGLEATIAVMADHTVRPVPDDAFAIVRDLEAVHAGETTNAEWSILHHVDGRDWKGPMDEHSKFNANRDDFYSMSEALDGLTVDIAAEIQDWKDEDDEVSAFGAERDYYLSQVPPYQPRNGLMRTTSELELVAGIWPDRVRGEDWNMNNRLDPNEDDGDHSFPDDDPDGRLDAGWSGRSTVHSTAGGPTASGERRIYLPRADPEELMIRLGLSPEQAEDLVGWGQGVDANLDELASSVVSTAEGATPQGVPASLGTLTDLDVRGIMEEVTLDYWVDRKPGRINVNTISPELLRDLLVDEEILADEILYMRDSRPEGIVNLLDLLEIRELTVPRWRQLASMMTTTSNVYTVTSRGRSPATGIEVEIVAVVDRSTVPIRIIEYREQ